MPHKSMFLLWQWRLIGCDMAFGFWRTFYIGAPQWVRDEVLITRQSHNFSGIGKTHMSTFRTRVLYEAIFSRFVRYCKYYQSLEYLRIAESRPWGDRYVQGTISASRQLSNAPCLHKHPAACCRLRRESCHRSWRSGHLRRRWGDRDSLSWCRLFPALQGLLQSLEN